MAGYLTQTAASVEVIPTVTAGSYSAGYIIGGVITIPGVLPDSGYAILNSLLIKFKGSVQNTELDVCVFTSNPSNGTYTDHGAPTWSASDNPALVGVYPMTASYSPLGTHTVYELDGIGKILQGVNNTLYLVVISKSALANNPASTTDMSIKVGTFW